MKTSSISCVALLSQLGALVAAAPPLGPPASSESLTTSLFTSNPSSGNVSTVGDLGRIPPPTPFYWSSSTASNFYVKFTRTTFNKHRHTEYVAKALENSYFELMYHVGPQGGAAWAEGLVRPLDWPGAPPGAVESTTLKVTPGPRLTWSYWSVVLAGLWSFSLKYEGYDFIAEIEWKDAPDDKLGEVSFTSRSAT